MVKIRVQCLPEHIGKTRASLERNFKIHSASINYPNKGSDFVRIYFEATPLVSEPVVRIQTVMDIIEQFKQAFDKSPSSKLLLNTLAILELKIRNAIDPTYQGGGEI
jgi:hypothetical protein